MFQVEMKVRGGSQDMLVVREVVRENCYLLPPQLGAEDVVIDLGAHIGAFTLSCLKRGCRKVIAVEPWGANFALLRDNVDRPEFAGRVELHQKAVWRSDGSAEELKFLAPENGATACGTVLSGQGEPVERVALDELLAQAHNLLRPPGKLIVKCDIEGAEYAVLYSSKRLFDPATAPDCLIGETHRLNREAWWCNAADGTPRPMDHAGMVCYLAGLGYRLAVRPCSPDHPGVNVNFWARMEECAYFEPHPGPPEPPSRLSEAMQASAN